MKSINFIYLFVIGTCLAACSYIESNSEMIVIDLNKDVFKTIPYSFFVDSITYIPLETTEECLIGKIRDVIISDSIVFVLKDERNEILLFNNQGKYLRKIFHEGEGPGEYRVINQMSYNEKRQSLSISSHKIIEYDLYGNLKNEFTPPFYTVDLHLFDNGEYLLSRLESQDMPDILVALVDSSGNIVRELLEKNQKYRIEVTNYWELISWNDKVHFISPQIDNILYSCGEDDSLRRCLNFKFLPENKNREQNDFIRSEEYYRKNYYRTLYRESNKWIHFVFCTEDNVRTLLYNKEIDEFIIGEIFKNDIDDKKHIFTLSASENNTFTNYVKPENEDDNPVIQILHLK